MAAALSEVGSSAAAHFGFVEEPTRECPGLLAIGRFLGSRSGDGEKCDNDEDSHGFTLK